ncbi:MAG TPA: UDP-N-acetylmuramoyl-L-alanine--D-glutamate ligase [Candidatus Saccharimonadales bacterium]
MNIAIAGFDTEGRSSLEFFQKRGDTVTVLDMNADVSVPDGIGSVLGPSYLDDLDRFDLVVRTAGMQPHLIFEKNPDLSKSKVTTQVNEFFEQSPTTNIIGVTGTKGKGTTSTLITRMLEAAGKDVHLAGNIGVPALELLPKLTKDSWVVLELSSFQLIDLKCSPMIAVCLMVAPEHLNWHADMAEYVTAKQQLFVWQTFDDIAIYFKDNEYSTTIAAAGNGAKVPYFAPPGAVIDDGSINMNGQIICHTNELKLLGQHNWQNVCAAITAAWQITHSVSALRAVLTTFSGLPHRLELVKELDGVKYYDDSFGTTPEAAIVAIQSFEAPKVVILGGSDKGASYDDLGAAVARGNVRKALLIGEQAGRIQAALQQAGFTDVVPGGDNMADIVANARAAAEPGDVVLLSTGCASFDMFKDYKDRAQQFAAAVQSL